jgi:hypothetical protein
VYHLAKTLEHLDSHANSSEGLHIFLEVYTKSKQLTEMAAATYFRCVCFQLILLMLLPKPAVPFSIVKSLPGFSGSLPFKLETG